MANSQEFLSTSNNSFTNTGEIPSEFLERDLFRSIMEGEMVRQYLSDNSWMPDETILQSENGQSIFPTPDRILAPLMHATVPKSKRNFKTMKGHFNDSEEPKKKKQTTEEKDQERNEQQREASRRYRKKKKELIEQLQVKLNEVTTIKDDFDTENKKLNETINKLKFENTNLKRSHLSAAERIDKERQSLLTKLEEALKSQLPDDQIVVILDAMDNLCKEISIIGECHWSMLISPNTVTHLAKSGFFGNQPGAPSIVEQVSDTHGIAQFANKVIEMVQLSQEQKEKLTTLVDRYYKQLQIWKEEREQINAEILEYFGKRQQDTQGDIQKLVHMVSTLELLRKNLSAEAASWETVSGEITDMLTIRQRAQFYLDVEWQHKSVMQLKSMWDSLTSVVKRK